MKPSLAWFFFLWGVVFLIGCAGRPSAPQPVAPKKPSQEVLPKEMPREQRPAPLPEDLRAFNAEIDAPERAGFTEFACTWRTSELMNQNQAFPAFDELRVYLNFGGIAALRRTDGSVAWKYDGRGSGGSNILSTPQFADERVIVGTNGYTVLGIGRETGELDWLYRTGGWVQAPVAIDLESGTAYAGCWDKKFHAVRLSDGAGLWVYPTEGRIGAQAAVSGRYVLYACLDTLVCLDREEGTLIHKTRFPNALISGPIVAPDRYVYAWCADGNLYGLALKTGPDGHTEFVEKTAVRISEAIDSVQEGFPHCRHAWFGENLLLLDDQGRLVFSDPGKGPLWEMERTDYQGSPCDFTTWDDGEILVALREGSVACVGLTDGKSKWKARLPGVTEPRILFSNDQLIVCSISGFVAAYQMSGGH